MGEPHRLALLVVAACGGACGPGSDNNQGAPDAAVDAAVDAGEPFAPVSPEPPAAPRAPALQPCPDGWRAVADADDPALVTCDPWPAGGPAACSDAEAHWPGEAACEPLGAACPDGDWAEDLPADVPILRVAVAGGPGGAGTLEDPFGSIAEALAAASDGTVVALSKGAFDEAVSLPAGVTLWGACVAETTIAPGAKHDEDYAVTLDRRGGRLVNLSITGARQGVLVTAPDAALEHVVVRSTPVNGVVVTGAGATLRAVDLVVRDVFPQGTLGGAGLVVVEGAAVELERGSFERIEGGLALLVRDAALVARDVAVHDVDGPGLHAFGGAEVTLERAAFDGERGVAIGVEEGGTELVATDLAVRDTRTEDGIRGVGLVVNQGAYANVSRASFIHNAGAGIATDGVLTQLYAADVIVSDTQPWDNGATGAGVQMAFGAFGDLTAVALVRNHQAGLFVSGGQATATDLIIRDTRLTVLQPGEGSETGDGVEIYRGGVVELVRAELTRNDRVGILVTQLGSTLEATDLQIVDGAAAVGSTEAGEGLVVQSGGRATLTRVLVSGNRTAGLDVRGFPSALVGTDVAVRQTRSRTSDGRFGVGLWVLEGARVGLVRAAFQDNQAYGIVSTPRGSLATFEDLLVDGVSAQECTTASCVSEGGGVGLTATLGGVLDARRFVETSGALCGVQVVDAALDLHEGEVRDNPIGANVQTQGYDVSRLEDRVRYLDNDRPLDSAELSVPDLADIPVFEDPR